MRSVQSTLFALLVASGPLFATSLNLTPGVSPISRDVYELHMTVFWICVAIGLVVFGAMFYAIIHHRKSKGAVAAQFHYHLWVEIGWTIVPVLILVVMAIPATKVLLHMNNYDQEALTIKITGYQWKWHYEYLEDGVSFFSNLSTPPAQLHNQATKGPNYLHEVDHPLVLPIHKKIRFLITSNDVNHAWWVPDFGVKRDAVAGFINEAWTSIDKPGTYRGQCAELCGINHAFMPIVVVATTEQRYKDWVAKQKGQLTQGEAETNREWTLPELMTQGEKVYGSICAACHQPTGTGLPPTFPALKGSAVATGPMEKHIDIVMNGVSGTAMQAFKSQLNDVDLASVITYERNAFGNNTNTFVQPIQIKAYRDGKSLAEALTVKPATTDAMPKQEPAAQPISASAPVPASPTPATATVTPTTPQAPAQVQSQPVVQQAGAIDAASQATSDVAKVGTSAGETPQPAGMQPQVATPPQTAAQPAPAQTDNPADALKAAITRGEKVYMSVCAVCHQPTGVGMPPVFPALKGDPITTGPVPGHMNVVLHGKPGTAMQAFKDQLNDQDLADVITYERNAWGNNTGVLVTPDEIKNARAQTSEPANQ